MAKRAREEEAAAAGDDDDDDEDEAEGDLFEEDAGNADFDEFVRVFEIVENVVLSAPDRASDVESEEFTDPDAVSGSSDDDNDEEEEDDEKKEDKEEEEEKEDSKGEEDEAHGATPLPIDVDSPTAMRRSVLRLMRRTSPAMFGELARRVTAAPGRSPIVLTPNSEDDKQNLRSLGFAGKRRFRASVPLVRTLRAILTERQPGGGGGGRGGVGGGEAAAAAVAPAPAPAPASAAADVAVVVDLPIPTAAAAPPRLPARPRSLQQRRRRAGTSVPVRAHGPNGATRVFLSQADAARQLFVPSPAAPRDVMNARRHIRRSLRSGKPYRGWWFSRDDGDPIGEAEDEEEEDEEKEQQEEQEQEQEQEDARGASAASALAAGDAAALPSTLSPVPSTLAPTDEFARDLHHLRPPWLASAGELCPLFVHPLPATASLEELWRARCLVLPARVQGMLERLCAEAPQSVEAFDSSVFGALGAFGATQLRQLARADVAEAHLRVLAALWTLHTTGLERLLPSVAASSGTLLAVVVERVQALAELWRELVEAHSLEALMTDARTARGALELVRVVLERLKGLRAG